MNPIVAYYRVSSDRQGRSGLGLEAQRAAVEAHAAATGATITESYTEVESGRRCDRPQLDLAVRAARLRRATLVVAKLDRLARDARFTLALADSGVGVRFLDLPDLSADPITGRLILTVMSALAEFESRRIAQRIREAFAARRARGLRMVPVRPFTAADAARGNRFAAAANRRYATAWRADMRPVAAELRRTARTLHATAAELTRQGYRTRRGREWTYATLHQLLTLRPWEEPRTSPTAR